MSRILVGYRVTAPVLATKALKEDYNPRNFDADMEDEEQVLFTRKYSKLEQFLLETPIMCSFITVRKLYDDASIEIMDLSHRWVKQGIDKDQLQKLGILDLLSPLTTFKEGDTVKRNLLHNFLRMFGLKITGDDAKDQASFLSWVDAPYMLYFKPKI